MTLISPFVFLQYNEELHYVEPCLNGTLVQADVTNKDVSLSSLVSFSPVSTKWLMNFMMKALAPSWNK